MTDDTVRDLQHLDELQCRYIEALDAQDMDAWLATFSAQEDASYICTTAENEAANHSIALMMDDCRARLEDRVTFVNQIWAGTYQTYRTRHFTQRTGYVKTGPGRYGLRSNFSLAYVPSDTQRVELFATGVYLDQVLLEEDGARFLSKKVITDAAVVARYFVFPL